MHRPVGSAVAAHWDHQPLGPPAHWHNRQAPAPPTQPPPACQPAGPSSPPARQPRQPPHLSLSVSSSILFTAWPVYSAMMRFRLALWYMISLAWGVGG